MRKTKILSPFERIKDAKIEIEMATTSKIFLNYCRNLQEIGLLKSDTLKTARLFGLNRIDISTLSLSKKYLSEAREV